MEGRINPENWKDIFSDTLYIITDPNGVSAVIPEEPAKASSPQPVQTAPLEAPKPTPAATATPTLPKTPSIPTPAVSIPKEQAAPAISTPAPLKPTGRYSNGILLLMHKSYTMTAAQQEMLGKIVKAVQLDYNDCGILHLSAPVSLKAIEALKPRIILSFGLPTDAFEPRLAKDLYAIQKHHSTILLLADSLAKLESTVALKSSLWNAMKEMFGMK